MIDFSKLGINAEQTIINPRDIFMSLPNKSNKFQYPRDVQGEVWKQWFEQRTKKDNIIKMNTGSGKTVVALMILQSCLNEGAGPALYVVPDKYLTDQVISQAKQLGVNVTRDADDLAYLRKKAILVINISKLVNGKSIFGLRESRNNVPIGSIIIDDMHACVEKMQEQFSIKISRGDVVYSELVSLFMDIMNEQSEGRFLEIVEGNNTFKSMLVPFWGWQEKTDEVFKVLNKNRDNENITFKLNLIEDNLKLSHCFISSREISIIPNCVPIHKISSLDDAKRRIYMSATLPDDSPFTTIMGIKFEEDQKVISPEKANDIGERMILIPKMINNTLYDDEIRDKIASKALEYNVLVIVPTYNLARIWEEYGAEVLLSDNFSEGIDQIKANKNGLYVIVNRYDGIDLPDDACRILVIDGLPQIENANDRYEGEVVNKSVRIQKEYIQRIEQGMGRGVRSSNDYCLVFLLGDKLTDVVYGVDGKEYFSMATKRQFELSEEMCEQIVGGTMQDIMDVGDNILNRTPEWIEICKKVVRDINYDTNIRISEEAKIIRYAFDKAQHKDFVSAAKIVNELVNSTDDIKLRGYYKQILAEYTNLFDKSDAQKILKSAKHDNIEMLNPIGGIQFDKNTDISIDQARNIINKINELNIDENKLILIINSMLSDLIFKEETAKPFEKAIKELFDVIGYKATMPERESGRGPDDFVVLGEGNYIVIECKNGVTTDTICKKDCNQLNGSYNWFGYEYSDNQLKCIPVMIHKSYIFDYDCSPINCTRIMTNELLEKLKDNVRKFFGAMCEKSNFGNVDKINELLRMYKLTRNDIVNEYTVDYKIKK